MNLFKLVKNICRKMVSFSHNERSIAIGMNVNVTDRKWCENIFQILNLFKLVKNICRKMVSFSHNERSIAIGMLIAGKKFPLFFFHFVAYFLLTIKRLWLKYRRTGTGKQHERRLRRPQKITAREKPLIIQKNCSNAFTCLAVRSLRICEEKD